MWELDQKESWALKNWCFWTLILEKALESSLDSKEIKPVNPKRNQSWIFIARTDAEAPIISPPDVKNWLIRKDPDAGKDWRQEEKGMTEDEMVGWHHQLNGHEFEQALGVADGQGSLVCCSPWGHKETRLSDWTELNVEKRASPAALVVKDLPANAGDIKMPVQSLGWGDPREEGRATHSSLLAWRIPWTEKPGGPWSMGSQKSWTWLNLLSTQHGKEKKDMQRRGQRWELAATAKEPPVLGRGMEGFSFRLPDSRGWWEKFLFFHISQLVVLCYSSPKELIY